VSHPSYYTRNGTVLHASTDYGLKRGGDGCEEVSTGTTIMAMVVPGGGAGSAAAAVVLGADSRVSTGTYVANRTSDKIAQLSEHVYCCRSGSAADTQAISDVVRHMLQQLRCVRASLVDCCVVAGLIF
jgi:20S proteasome subunit beta 1